MKPSLVYTSRNVMAFLDIYTTYLIGPITTQAIQEYALNPTMYACGTECQSSIYALEINRTPDGMWRIHCKCKSIYCKWKSVYCKWKSVYCKWKSVYCKWKSVYCKWKSVYCKWKSVYLETIPPKIIVTHHRLCTRCVLFVSLRLIAPIIYRYSSKKPCTNISYPEMSCTNITLVVFCCK